MRTIVFFYKEKKKICTDLYGFNECPIFKRASTMNISLTML